MTYSHSHLGSLARRLALGLAAVLCLAAFAASNARAVSGHGQLLRLAPGPGLLAPGSATSIRGSKSQNWFGYNQGALERGEALFHEIAGNWAVPRASQHTKNEAEYSSDWIGIGGGCENSNCSVQDETLIQAGTEQDVSRSGKPSYSAWWEVIPSPSVRISMKVRPGDHMHAQIRQVTPMVWRIAIADLTSHKSFSTTVPYSSTEGSAEWIEETPLVIGGGSGGFAPLPNLSRTRFDSARTNGQAANLKASQTIELTTASGKVVGVPSRPDPDHNGFNACAWAKFCPAPR